MTSDQRIARQFHTAAENMWRGADDDHQTDSASGSADYAQRSGMDAEGKAALREEFPGWSIIWTRDTGRWWATRTSCRAEANGVARRADLVTEAAADSAGELRAALREIARQDAAAK